MKLRDLLELAVSRQASDLHLIAGLPPVLRVYGEIIITEGDVLSPAQVDLLIRPELPPERLNKLETDRQVCYSLQLLGLGYFRISIYHEKGTLGASVRIGMTEMRSLSDLGLPEGVDELTRLPSGLILITGPTGSGKTTTLNSMIDLINRERRCKIIIVEDPIEYVHTNKRSIIVQQEVYSDTPSFSQALIHILRQDPDVIGVGEMRDQETIATGLTAAETGHLVISTLHTPDAAQTVHRIVDVFPADQQNQIRLQLSSCLQAVISQQLLPRIDKPGRVLASELMLATPAVRSIIREGKMQGLRNALQIGTADGMQTLDACLRDLYQKGYITYDVAASRSTDQSILREAAPTGVGN